MQDDKRMLTEQQTFGSFRAPCFQPPQETGRWWRASEIHQLCEIYKAASSSHEEEGPNNNNNDKTYSNKKQAVLMHGPPGSGKRTCLQAFQAFVENEQGGLVLRIQHSNAQGLRHPHAALFDAMLSFARHVLEMTKFNPKAEVLARLRSQTYAANDGGQLEQLIQTVPVLSELLLNRKVEKEETFDKEAEDCVLNKLTPFFRYSFQSFLQAISDPVHPLVLVVENLQWARESTLDVLGSLGRDVSHRGIMLLSVYRDQDQPHVDSMIQRLGGTIGDSLDLHQMALVGNFLNHTASDSHRIASAVQKIGEARDVVEFHQMTVENNMASLSAGDGESRVQGFLTQILGPVQDMESLAEFVFEATRGTSGGANLLCLDQVLYWLYDRGWLRRCEDETTETWVYEPQDDENEDEEENNYDKWNLVKMIESSVDSLSDECKETFRFLICMGSQIPWNVLSSFGSPEVLVVVLKQMKAADILREENESICFSHDFVHYLLYHSISQEDQAYLHYRLARRIWKNQQQQDETDCSNNSERSSTNFDKNLVGTIVDHLRLGQDYIKSSPERIAISKLCLNAAQQSVKFSAFLVASRYLEFGLTLMKDEERRWRDEYDFCLELYNATAEIALCTAQFRAVDVLAEEACQNALSFADTLTVRSAKIYVTGTSGNPIESVALGCDVLSRLGVDLPMHPSPLRSQRALSKVRKLLRGKSTEAIKRLPPMNDHEKLSALKILSILFSYCFSVNPFMAPFIAYHSIRLTLEHGICSISSVGFVLYGAILCRLPKGASEGVRFGRLAMEIQRSYRVDIWSGRVSAVYYGGIHGWKSDFRSALPHVEFASRQCMLVGDKEFGMRIANVLISMQLDLTPIPDLVKTIRRVRGDMQFYSDKHNLGLSLPLMFILLKLSGRTDGDFELLQHSCNFPDVLSKMDESSGVTKWGFYAMMMVSYLFGEYEKAFEYSLGSQGLLQLAMGAGDSSVTFVYDGLVNVEMARKSKGMKRLFHIQRAKKRLWSLRHLFASIAPFNFLGKSYLLGAEIDALTGKHASAYANYASAISLSKEGGFLVGTALSLERAGKFFLKLHDHELASKFLRSAVEKYKSFGAEAKANHLIAEIGDQDKLDLMGSSLL